MSVKVLQDARLKAAQTAVGQRTLDFYAAAFSSVPDKNGDVIDSHALDAWLPAFYKAGKPLPISFAHAAVRNDLNPFEIIGYAPADAEHVWTDDYGLRIKAFLDVADNPTAQQVASLVERGIVRGASVAFIAVREKRQKDGAARITQMEILEAGPCLTPANEEAIVLGLKVLGIVPESEPETTETEPTTETEIHKETETVTEDTRTTEVEPETTEAPEEKAHEPAVLTTDERQVVIEALASASEMKHGTAPTHIQHAHDALVRAGAKCAASEAAIKNDSDDVQAWLRRMRHIKLSVT